MKKMILGAVMLLALLGCSGEVRSTVDNWAGWTNQAAFLNKHYDEQTGVVCYISTRSGTAGHGRNAPLSCVKVN